MMPKLAYHVDYFELDAQIVPGIKNGFDGFYVGVASNKHDHDPHKIVRKEFFRTEEAAVEALWKWAEFIQPNEYAMTSEHGWRLPYGQHDKLSDYRDLFDRHYPGWRDIDELAPEWVGVTGAAKPKRTLIQVIQDHARANPCAQCGKPKPVDVIIPHQIGGRGSNQHGQKLGDWRNPCQGDADYCQCPETYPASTVVRRQRMQTAPAGRAN